MSDQRLEQLQLKYQSVLNLIETLGVRLMNLHVQDDKLVIRAQAPTKAESNRVWDQIKLVDENYRQDLMAEIPYDQEEAPAKAKTYTVQSGDSLSKIAKEHYGDAMQYMKIFEANRDQLSNPDQINVGQVLTIPE